MHTYPHLQPDFDSWAKENEFQPNECEFCLISWFKIRLTSRVGVSFVYFAVKKKI